MVEQKSFNLFKLPENRQAFRGKDDWGEKEIALALIQYQSGKAWVFNISVSELCRLSEVGC